MDDDIQNLRTLLQERGIDEEQLRPDRHGTIVPPTHLTGSTSAWSTALEPLPPAGAIGERVIELREEIGRGGMGVVHAGWQRSLDREVAVKTVLDSSRTADAQALLREAWITGQLQHPNVIPVHTMYLDDGAPLLVMKRVEGHAWSEVLRRGRPLEAELRTFTQLCHVVHFAHTRGFVHLDLKPANVMIGSFGEVYLLDWGVAASTRDDAPPYIPRVRDLRFVIGTPAYMAPELVAAEGAIDARTDVYLMGAVLYELLAGRPPHLAKTMVASLASALASHPPTYPDHVPQGLRAIADRAMARAPGDRYATAAELREAIEDYLVHADSLSLAATAQQRFDQLRAGAPRDDEARERLDRVAGEAEFAFRQALHIWADNDQARAGLQALLEHLIARDLAEGRWQLAARRYADLPDPRPALDAQIQRARTHEASAVDELRRMREDADLGKAAWQRAALGWVGAVGWTSLIGGLGIAERTGLMTPTNLHMFAITVVAAVIFFSFVYFFRDAMTANEINRKLVSLLSLGWIFGVLYWVAAWAADAPFRAAVVGIGPLIALVVAAGAVTTDPRLRPHAIAALIGVVVQLSLVAWAIEILAVTGGVILAMMGRTWAKPPPLVSSTGG